MPNKTQWTPGPWPMIAHGERDSRVGADTLIAIVYSRAFRDQENQRANAQLIASAPDLYDTLAAMVEAIENPDRMSGVLLNQAITVLAKARGESV